MSDNKKNWKELPIGGSILEAGNSKYYITGTWRTFIPEFLSDKCIHCFMCWMFCPDNSIIIKDDKMVGMDYDHCKGCGNCAYICPKQAIIMKKEEK